ncbi:hypothetical protein M406DRAFT_343680 [Cryphonectria parasitica EP155]|uniref:GED domain-containing protein n=1 Tax=Cryphonectria parasitica (strain ATCC 38755 / EP155) TaxID=660469 RepID=A0A9P4XR58_CRYP1|nr:uncharacterized protein M406DRAFT_343680 [Cryphonectria parasitica EP155]KAF3760087.1 hypothetical protein M406DRAFT_343680 [Cryphonectria parasitica EP155]
MERTEQRGELISSVLEAISGVSFPIKSNLCTRFPTKLVLRKTPRVGISILIVSDHSRSDSEKAGLSSFHAELESFDSLATLIENAKSAMSISMHGKAFSKNLLRVEISGSNHPYLTIVDLPSLIHSQTKNQIALDIELIQDVIKSYIKQSQNIILAVISAKNNFANQIILKLARTANVSEHHTLSIITKPDMLLAGSESEALYVSLARNQEIDFRLSWHVLKNMDSETSKGSLAQRSALEDSFFAQGIWRELPESILGVGQLHHRLSKVLLNHIISELLSLAQDIEGKRTSCQNELEKLSQPRGTLDEQQLYLLCISESFQRLDTETERGYQQRIRAVAQNLNENFSTHLGRKGHRRQILSYSVLPVVYVFEGITFLTRDDFIKHVQVKMYRFKGRELPGLFNPMIIADLFQDQASSWEGLACDHVRSVWKACKTFLRLVIEHIADVGISAALIQKFFEPAMAEILAALETNIGDVVKLHQIIHSITYNAEFTEIIQRVRANRKRAEYAAVVKRFFNVSTLQHASSQSSKLEELVETLVRETTELNMDRYAAIEALDCMEAYYKIAMKRFVDDVAVEIIEVQLVSILGDILFPSKVYKMDPTLLGAVAGESEEYRTLREQLKQQLEVLSKGAETCKRFVGNKFSSMAEA